MAGPQTTGEARDSLKAPPGSQEFAGFSARDNPASPQLCDVILQLRQRARTAAPARPTRWTSRRSAAPCGPSPWGQSISDRLDNPWTLPREAKQPGQLGPTAPFTPGQMIDETEVMRCQHEAPGCHGIGKEIEQDLRTSPRAGCPGKTMSLSHWMDCRLQCTIA